ncbi:hypothetical protein T4A_13732, partial [Trichinella pseudospiralis]
LFLSYLRNVMDSLRVTVVATGPYIFPVCLTFTSLYQLLTDVWWVWSIFTISACIQALITCFQPKLVGHYLFRFLNSFTLLAGFFWLLFVVWSTYELCLYTNGILPQPALINESSILAVIVIWCSLLRISAKDRSRLRQLIRKFLRLTIAMICGFVLLWAGFCKSTYSFPMPYQSTFQTVESDF